MKKIAWSGLTLGLLLTLMAHATAQTPRTSPGLGDAATLPADLKNDAPMPQLTESGRRERLTFLLSGYEFFPKRADLDRVGPAAKISRDDSLNLIHQLTTIMN